MIVPLFQRMPLVPVAAVFALGLAAARWVQPHPIALLLAGIPSALMTAALLLP
ncbi:MAG: hypothetical protein HYV92_01700 [Candidatus Rokubacteria bacterium]|nr:hypothetical protein [Candidatus Rokubacteria bacterium]